LVAFNKLKKQAEEITGVKLGKRATALQIQDIITQENKPVYKRGATRLG
jgi:hypothetical protein